MSWLRSKTKPQTKAVSINCRLLRLADRLNIKSHLAYCELKLRLATKVNQTKRWQVLQHLNRYWRGGKFPDNNFKSLGRQPIFIDERGTYCAVGYLMAATGSAQLARQINQTDRFVRLEATETPAITAWLKQYQFTQAEAALIQPAYVEYSVVHHGMNFWSILIALVSILLSVCLFLPVFAVLRTGATPRVYKLLKLLGLFCLIIVTAGAVGMIMHWRQESLGQRPGGGLYSVVVIGGTVCLTIYLLKQIKAWSRVWLKTIVAGGLLALAGGLLIVHFVESFNPLIVNLSLAAGGLIVAASVGDLSQLTRRSRRTIGWLVAACVLLLTLVVPSIRYTTTQLTAQGSLDCPKYYSSYYIRVNDGFSDLWRVAVCAEIEQKRLPRLLTPSFSREITDSWGF